ncbi:MAG: adenylate kinase [Streptococcaceae bacterium]|jgi:Cdc6-like AAA superfamily ATPase|nr:adenylate kinase [Streptococcaceae bacterium]
MIILIAGPSHTGKTQLAQKLMERLAIPYFSIDHLKMGLIKSGRLNMQPTDSDETLTTELWPIVSRMIDTAIQNKQNLIVEGCYIPFDYLTPFTEAERREITYTSLAFSDAYLGEKMSDILRYESVIEWRFPTLGHSPYPGELEKVSESFRESNKKQRETCEKFGLNCYVIDKQYDLEAIINWVLEKVHSGGECQK